MIVDDDRTGDGRAAVYEDGPFRHVMAVPLRSGERVIGVIVIYGGDSVGAVY